jgi:ABC-type phosphate/phosphonate transport system substrate-binding protein
MRAVFAILSVVFICSCNYGNAAGVAKETAWTPPAEVPPATSKRLSVTLAVNDIYCADTSCSCVRYIANRKYTSLQKLLREKYGIDLNLRYFPGQFEFERELASGGVDGAISKPWVALRIANKEKLDYRRIADIPDPDGNRWLWGMVIVNTNSPIQTLSDLTGKRLAIGNDDGYEKYYAGFKMLRDNKILPAEIIQRASCLENIGLLLDGQVDAALVSHYVLIADCAVDMVDPDDFREVATTQKSPLTSVILDFGKISDADALRLRTALLEIKEDEIPGFLGKGFELPAAWTPNLTVPTRFQRGTKNEK